MDALRGVAILGVVLSHLTGYWMRYIKVPLPLPLSGLDATDFVYFGARGVTLFFLLSGYLLTWTEEKRARSGVYSVRSYAYRRALRLVPAAWVAIALVVIIWPTNPSIVDVLKQASFLYAWWPGSLAQQADLTIMDHAVWSLSTEVTFYCLLPIIILKLPSLRQRMVLLGVLVLVSLAIRIYWTQNIDALAQTRPDGSSLFAYLYFLPLTHLWLFPVGMILRMLSERSGAPRIHALQPQLASGLALFSVLAIVAFPLVGLSLHDTRQGLLMMLVDLLVVCFFASAILGAPLLRGVLGWSPLRRIGLFSYSLFLLHGTVLVVFHKYLLSDPTSLRVWLLDHGPAAVWFAYAPYAFGILTVACAVSYLSYRFIESPFLQYKPK